MKLFNDSLNNDQIKAATYDKDNKDILVMAGPGSGKTKTMISRVEFLINKGILPSKILCLTFTNKAARELKSRLKTNASEDFIDDIMACTFHSFCVQIIKQIPKSFGFKTFPSILDSSEQTTIMKSCKNDIIKEMNIEDQDISGLPKAEKIISEYSFARNSNKTIEEHFNAYLTDNPEYLEFAIKMVSNYEKEKKEYGYVDFDDLLHIFINVVENKKDLASAISSMFEEVLVDEAQDNNPMQYKILELLSKEQTRVFAVGDAAQSIYSFRGADFDSIFNFQKVFPQSVVLNLPIDYRNSQEIVDTANALLKGSVYNYSNILKSAKGYIGEQVEMNSFYNKEEEASFISKDIVKQVNEKGFKYSDIFVIVRSAYYGISIEAFLNKFKIPYQIIGGMSINKAVHIKDLMSILKFAVKPNDKLAAIHYLSMFKGVGPKTAFNLYEKVKKIPSMDDQIIQTINKKIKDEHASNLLFSVISALKNKKNPIKNLIEAGFLDYIKDKYKDNYSYRIDHIKTISDIFKQYNGDIESFINDFTLEPEMTKSQEKDSDKDIDKVTLITAHSSKGMEKEICYVAGVGSSGFPSRRSIGNEKNEEEERRVLFVAMTRAINKLILTNVDEFKDVYLNAKTDIDFIKTINDFVKNKRKNKSYNNKGIKGLSDIF